MREFKNSVLFTLVFIATFQFCDIKTDKKHDHKGKKSEPQHTTIESSSEIQQFSDSVLGIIHSKNYIELSEIISPKSGIRFSPYAYVDSVDQVHLFPEDFKNALEQDKKFLWGYSDGKGDSIYLDIASYFDQFVYDREFIQADSSTINAYIGMGNSLNNLKEIYPNSDFVEYHFFGDQQKYAGMDWKSLRLVFEKIKDSYYLIGIVHDQWTI